jgi:hypothetical protein
MAVSFNPNSFYTTVIDIDGSIYAIQNGLYFDRYGNSFGVTPKSVDGYQGVQPTRIPRTAAQLAGSPSSADLALGSQVVFYDPNQTVGTSTPLLTYSTTVTGYVPTGSGGGGGGGGATTFTALTDASSVDIPSVNPSVGALATQITALQANQLNDLNVPAGWNASTNTPTLVSSTAAANNVYIVTTAGSTTLDGISSWPANSLAMFGVGGVATWTIQPPSGFLGTFATAAALDSAFPHATYPGCNALVGSAAPYTLYYSNALAWAATIPGGLTVSIGANTTITTANQTTYNGNVLEFTGNYTVTINLGLAAGFGFSYIPFSSGNSTIASDGTTTLNGATTSQVRTAALVVGSVVQRVSNANQYVVI